MCKTRVHTKIHPRLRRGCKVRVKRGVIIGPAVDAGPGATRRRGSGTAGGGEIRGNLEIASVGAKRERMRGNPQTRSGGKAGRCGCGATRRPHREARRAESSCGATRWFTPPGSAKGCRVEATRSSIAGTAGRCGNRGNPEPHRETASEERVCGVTRGYAPRSRRRMREPGQLGTPSPARSEDAGSGSARSLIDRRDWHSEFAGQPGES